MIISISQVNCLNESSEVCVGWLGASKKGIIQPNEVALLFAGGYGWYYVLLLMRNNAVIGLVIYPMKEFWDLL